MHAPFEVLEQLVESKRPGFVAEDIVAGTDDFVVVLDGVTGKDGSLFRGLTGGRFAAETVLRAIEKLDRHADARTAVNLVSEALHDAVIRELGAFPPPPPGTQLAVYSAARAEVWRVGDVHVRLGSFHLHTPAPPTDEIATNFRAAVLEAFLAEGASEDALADNDPSWALLLPLLSRQDLFANAATAHPLGYGVINGLKVPDRHLSVFPVASGMEVVLATDGYLSAEGTLDEAEAELASVLAEDRLLIRRYKGFRAAPPGGSFDDRGWIRFITR